MKGLERHGGGNLGLLEPAIRVVQQNAAHRGEKIRSVDRGEAVSCLESGYRDSRLFHGHSAGKPLPPVKRLPFTEEQQSDLRGLHSEYITDKLIANCRIGSNANTNEGGVKVADSTFSVYLSGWQAVVTGLLLQEGDDGELEHKPAGGSYWLDANSGNSNDLGIDGKPIVQQHITSMGAYQPDLVIDGGSF